MWFVVGSIFYEKQYKNRSNIHLLGDLDFKLIVEQQSVQYRCDFSIIAYCQLAAKFPTMYKAVKKTSYWDKREGRKLQPVEHTPWLSEWI